MWKRNCGYGEWRSKWCVHFIRNHFPCLLVRWSALWMSPNNRTWNNNLPTLDIPNWSNNIYCRVCVGRGWGAFSVWPLHTETRVRHTLGPHMLHTVEHMSVGARIFQFFFFSFFPIRFSIRTLDDALHARYEINLTPILSNTAKQVK